MKACDIKEGYLYKDYDKRGHCANGTFVAKKFSDTMHISDTYWNSNKDWIKTTDDYVKNFIEVLKLDEWELTNWDRARRYSEEDVVQIHYTQCSGRNLGTTDYFLRVGANQNQSEVKALLEKEIKYTEGKLNDMKRQLAELESGDIDIKYIWIG